MPRGKRLSDADKVAQILAKFNIETDEPIVVPEANYNHTNAVAMFGKTPEHFVLGVCQECNQKFAHNQPIPAGTRVGYCSDSCRKRAFEKNTGIKWESVITQRREPWDGDPPMIITPEQLKNLEAIADWFTKNRTTLEIQNPEPESELPDLEDSFEYPRLILPEQAQADFDFDSSPLIYVQENQYPEAAHTSPLPAPVALETEQMLSADDPFDFS